jgi:hypothetical protein
VNKGVKSTFGKKSEVRAFRAFSISSVKFQTNGILLSPLTISNNKQVTNKQWLVSFSSVSNNNGAKGMHKRVAVKNAPD